MELFDYKINRINNMTKNVRLAYKKKENANKPPLISNDVLETADFTFTKFMIEQEGDSGQLLLSKRKTDQSEQYLVKHAFTDCAANEFVYTKLAQAMSYHMPDAKLFRLSSDEKCSYFKTEYIIGERFLSLIDNAPSFETIQNHASNWLDIFGFYAMESMFSEGDGIEVVLAADGLLYRIDTASSFAVNNWELDNAGIDIEYQGANINNVVRDRLLSRTFDAFLNASYFDIISNTAKNIMEMFALNRIDSPSFVFSKYQMSILTEFSIPCATFILIILGTITRNISLLYKRQLRTFLCW